MTPPSSRPLLSLSCTLAFSLAACSPYHGQLRRYLENGTESSADIKTTIARWKKSYRDNYRSDAEIRHIDVEFEQQAWKIARRSGRSAAIERFLVLYPNGAFTMAAEELKTKLELTELHANPTPENVSRFISDHPKVDLPHQFDGALAELDFRKAQSLDRGQAWEIYIAQYPNSPRIAEAKAKYFSHIARAAEEFQSTTLGALAATADAGPGAALPPQALGIRAADYTPEEHRRLREEAAARIPGFRARLCARTLSRDLIDGSTTSDVAANLRRRIKDFLTTNELPPGDYCAGAQFPAPSPDRGRFLIGAYRALAKIDEELREHEARLRPTLLKEAELRDLVSRAAEAVDELESRELASEALLGRNSVVGEELASTTARKALTVAKDDLAQLTKFLNQTSPLDKTAQNAQAHNMIAGFLIALLEVP